MFERATTGWLIRRGMRMASAVCVASIVAGQVTGAHTADLELGRHLASECMTCHGTAKADSTIPNIFGLGEAHFVEVVRAYRAKALPNPVMQIIASRLNDEDIAALAAFFAIAKK
jgi:cytochrome c553